MTSISKISYSQNVLDAYIVEQWTYYTLAKFAAVGIFGPGRLNIP